jgi:hypothetical protein
MQASRVKIADPEKAAIGRIVKSLEKDFFVVATSQVLRDPINGQYFVFVNLIPKSIQTKSPTSMTKENV